MWLLLFFLPFATCSWILLPKRCVEEADLYARRNAAEVVLTGTVVDIESAPKVGREYKGQVAVKRIIKGGNGINSRHVNAITIENFGDRRICDSVVGKRDTKIFFLSKNSLTGNYRLNSSVARLNLKNLDGVSGGQKGVSATRAPVSETPCEKLYCGPRAICRRNSTTGKAGCVDLEDPCRSQPCNFGATCVGNYLTGHRTCVCPSKCHGFPPPPSQFRNLKPDSFICSTDNVTYDNYCQLQLKSCREQRPIAIDSVGVCGGCEKQQCDFYSKCEIDLRGAPKCICPSSCPQDRKAVCGVDGITYANECELRKTACEQKRFIVAAASYPCEQLGNHLPTTSAVDEDYVVESEDYALSETTTSKSKQIEAERCDKKLCHDLDGRCISASDGTNCVCKFNCSSTAGKAVCGISAAEGTKRLFANECFLKQQACQEKQRIRVHPPADCEELVIQPCYGAQPLKHNRTGKELYCGDGAFSELCPPGSYCHKSVSSTFAKCCPQESAAPSLDCSRSKFGCCPDKVTPAKGHDGLGCRKQSSGATMDCKCNKIGSVAATCDPESNRCKCRPGVTGTRCDRCQPGFWGLKKHAVQMKGCLPCGCSNFGSVRADCEQMTGRCVCKAGVLGMKCDSCPPGQILQPSGCVSADTYPDKLSSCGELICHLGAVCVQRNGLAECQCNITCHDQEPAHPVCGSDGFSYSTICMLRLHACRMQKDITIASMGPCGEGASKGYVTISPQVAPLGVDLKHASYKTQSLEQYGSSEITESAIKFEAGSGGLGDSCGVDPDCAVRDSFCYHGKCVCSNGYDVDLETQVCKKIQPRTAACMKNPCKNGGTCFAASPASYRCSCAPGFLGTNCEEEVPRTVPSFNGKSYYELKSIHGQTQLNLELELMPHATDGIILFNSQKPDGSGDFISMSLNNGFVEFRYDLGDGPALIRSSQQLTIGKKHRIIAKRFNQDGMVQVDDFPEARGSSPGSKTSLDLGDSLFIGYVPTSSNVVFDKIGTKNGLVGCLYSLRIGRAHIGLTDAEFRGVVAAFEIGECGKNACASSPCLNGATCEGTTKALEFKCVCAEGFSGARCEVADASDAADCKDCLSADAAGPLMTRDEFLNGCADGSENPACNIVPVVPDAPFIPEFDGNGYIELPTLTDINPRLNLEVWFLAKKRDGLLLYAAKSPSGLGDFIALSLRNGRLEFSFDLGHGPANISYPEQIKLNNWHAIKVHRYGRRASLQLDDGQPISGETQGTLEELNLSTRLYLGGHKKQLILVRQAKLSQSFTGAIQMLSINGGQITDLIKTAMESEGIKAFESHRCHQKPSPCLHGGYCIPRMASYKCKCSPSFRGDHCEHALTARKTSKATKGNSGQFDGHTFLEFPNAVTRRVENQEKNSFKFKLRTKQLNGLIIWQGRGGSVRDYLSLAIVNGSVEFSYDLGKEQSRFFIRSNIFVSDGRWHSVEAERHKRSGTLCVDKEEPVTLVSSSGTTMLNTDGKLFIGGSINVPSTLPPAFHLGYSGCLSDVSVAHAQLPLRMNGSVHVPECSSQ